MLSPIENLPFLYINGCNISISGASTAQATAGQCRDSLNNFDIVLPAATINITRNGLNGLDTGTVAASTWYAVYAIGSSTKNSNSSLANPTGYLLSLSATQPTMPTSYPVNYDIFRRIGWVYMGSGLLFLPFYQYGSGSSRSYTWDVLTNLINGTLTTSFVAYSLAAQMPPSSRQAIVQTSLNPNTAGNIALYRPTGSNSSGLVIAANAAVSPAISFNDYSITTGVSQNIDVKSTNALDSVTVAVVTFIDNL